MKIFIICTILAAANAAFLPTIQSKYSECEKGCPYIYLPVCGSNDKGEYKIFSNDCDMDVQNCKLNVKNQAVFTEVPMTKCKVESYEAMNIISNCNKPCPDNYAPVCGYNGLGEYKVFDTECLMNVENCNRKSRSEIAFVQVLMEMCENNQEQLDNIVLVKNDNEDLLKHCNKPCLDIYDPVCGYDGHSKTQIFASECDMEVENCRVQVLKGFVFMKLPLQNCNLLDSDLTLTSANEKKNCNKICTADYNPVCGYNGIEYHTFGNLCEYESINCESNFNWRFTNMGEC